METLLRNALGDTLREIRLEQGKTLRWVATNASVALGYLSEVERGQKEVSSELLEGILDALGVNVPYVLLRTADQYTRPAPVEPDPEDEYADLILPPELTRAR